MSREADFPFTGYTLYGPYTFRRHGRKMVHLVRKPDRHKMTLTVARYKMCVHLGRVLETSEEVDHVDENPHNDDLDNLQILTRLENIRKGSGRAGRLWVRMTCPSCEKIFELPQEKTHLTKGGQTTSCSRSCSFKTGWKLRKNPGVDPVDLFPDNVLEEFRVYTDWNNG